MVKYYEHIFQKLEELAIKADHPWAKVSAAVVFTPNDYYTATNSMKSHPFQLKYAKNKDAIFLHAEIAAIKMALKWRSLSVIGCSDLYICRMKKINKVYIRGLAKPCEGCMRAIVEFGLKNVIFTTDEGSVEHL